MIGMGAKSITIVRAVTADFFFDCRAAEVPSDERIRDVPELTSTTLHLLMDHGNCRFVF
jgi:hypothetical protein